jgi:NarL family two-component system response regulator YdfI
MARLMAQTKAPAGGESPNGLKLTTRELEVLQAVARGGRSKEIALALGISERTVKAHISSIFSRLGVDSRAAAIAAAARLGILIENDATNKNR